MKTYQDLLDAGENENDRIKFILEAITDHRSSPTFIMAADAEEYDRKNNVTIMQYQKILYTVAGEAVIDMYSPNHKICSNFFNRFTTQENQYLLSNGVTLEDPKNKEKLGRSFDQRLQQMGRNALVQGVSFGFWNLDHLEVFKLTEFVPLYDEETGALSAGIRFFQIDADKPLQATLYEIDGYTEYSNNNEEKKLAVKTEKKDYKEIVTQSEVDGIETSPGGNYPGFPIVPMWGNQHHQSELVGLRQSIDAYDLIKSGFANDLDGELIYWIMKNSGGMSEKDISKFINRLRAMGATSAEGDDDLTVKEKPIPYEAREAYLDRLEQDMYNDYQALNVADISGGNKTATEINAAYQPFDNKVDMYEYCVLEFLEGLFKIVGIEDNPSFTRNKIASQNDDMQTLLLAAEYLDDEYITRRACAILGDPDAADDILDRKANADVNRLLNGGGNEPTEPEPDDLNE